MSTDEHGLRKRQFILRTANEMMIQHHGRQTSLRFLLFLSVCLSVHPWFLASPASAQEVAVNLAEGRVVICAAKDGIIVATVDAHSQPDSPPAGVVALEDPARP